MPTDELPDEEEDIEEFEIPDDDTPKAPPDDTQAGMIALSALMTSSIMLVSAMFRTGKGMMGHTPLESLGTIRVMMWIGVAVVLFGAFALNRTRPFEGTIIRGAAVAASAISFVAELLLATSLVELLQIVSQ